MNKGSFRLARDIPEIPLPFGSILPLANPGATGGRQLTVMDAKLNVGQGHNFHKHPEQEEVIYVLAGKIEQWIGEEKRILGPGDSVFIPAGVVHGSFTHGDSESRLLAILGPSIADGFTSIEVADEAPWKTLR